MKVNCSNLYLVKLFRQFKLLFAVVLIWMAGTGFFALKSREEFPFLHFGMYSLRENEKPEHITYSIVIDNKEVIYSDLWDAQREVILSPLSHFSYLMNGGHLSNEQEQQFKAWLYRYAADMRMIDENVLQVFELRCIYNAEGLPQVVDRKLLFTYAAN